MASLFRKEVLNKTKNQYFSKALIVTPISLSYILLFILLATITIILFLFTNSYAKKEKVTGYLIPTNGISKVYSHVNGIVSQLNIKEGDHVELGDNLLTVSSYKYVEESISVDKAKLREADLQIAIVNNQIKQVSLLFAQKKEQAVTMKNILIKENKELEQQSLFLNERLLIAKTRLKNMTSLSLKGNVSKNEVTEHLDIVLDLQQRIQEHSTRILKSEAEIANLNNELVKIPYEKEQQINQLNIEVSQLLASKFNIQENNELILKSAVSGTVTSIKLAIGEFASQGDYLVSILPDHSELQAEIYVPTRAIGFIKQGDEVNFKFDAFPFQKFGVTKGDVSHISKNIVFAAETNHKLSFNEPVYKIKAKLHQQYINAYGNHTQLIPGMLLHADIITDNRSLFEWLLEPLYILKGY
ncbi:HlyD family efflux transporter periplasmic adaptor subunit [uncultured Shewanella sp.]|uniref:HlyD family secretion protein n=1 Tax=uncultured Shewanella sp. TaxID=173975 RepID=UPI00261046B5|nr:HlyD family efflux transporter periplasmic adaptor subunit [uncultured Shewanella sp.]